MKKREIPTKNYVILCFLGLGTILLVFYLSSWYRTAKNYYQNNSVLTNFLVEINVSEIGNYVLDNPSAVIYMASSNDTTIKSFEEEFKEYLIQEEVKDVVRYLDIKKMTPEDYDKIGKYLTPPLRNISIGSYPNILVFKEGKIDDVLYKSTSSIALREVKLFFISHEVVDID